MNLIQTFIIEVHSFEYFEYYGQTKVKVDMTVDSYGKVERVCEVFSEDAWEGAKEKGWYLS